MCLRMGVAGLAGATGEVTRQDVLARARANFLAGRRLDVVALASDFGVARATIYRWFGARDALLGEVLWSLIDDTLERIEETTPPSSPDAIAQILVTMLHQVTSNEGMRAALTREPALHLSVLTSRQGVVQGRLVERLQRVVSAGAPDAVSPDFPLDQLAYLLVRVAEAYCYADVVSGRPVDVELARPAFLRLLGGPR